MLVTSFNCGYILSFSNLILVPLGWTWGIICLLVVGFYIAYGNWLLAAFHFVDGQRFIRYRDIMGSLYGELSRSHTQICNAAWEKWIEVNMNWNLNWKLLICLFLILFKAEKCIISLGLSSFSPLFLEIWAWFSLGEEHSRYVHIYIKIIHWAPLPSLC